VTKNIEIIQQEGLLQHVNEVLAPTMWERLHAMASHPLVGEVRGLGAIAGIQLTADKETREFFPEALEIEQIVVRHAYANGTIIRGVGGDILAFTPCLTTTADQINMAADATEKALDQTMKELGL
jgi:adenosylmethionine-8-amino-7-oxononanoate aminotransferase